MAPPVMLAKLRPPDPRPNAVPRARLLDRLHEGLSAGVRVTLVSAPAGFGKTTLVSAWLTALDRAVAWISLDAGDSDPVRFRRYLVTALSRAGVAVEPGARAAPSPLLNPDAGAQSPRPDDLAATLTNALSTAQQPLVLVLDDYHLMDSSLVHDLVSGLVEHQPPTLHLVLVTRRDPPLPLPRWRVRNWLQEIREPALRFDAGESEAFIRDTMELDLSPAAIATLAARTEGWVAALQLAAISLRHQTDAEGYVAAFSGSDRLVADYLVSEVLAGQPDAVQAFILRTSILRRMSAPLCVALEAAEADANAVGRAQAMLEYLDGANLFVVPQDTQRVWYRYHHLFADLLRRRLAHNPAFPTAHVANLHRQAAHWYARTGNVDEAVYHALEAPDFPLAQHLIEQHGEVLINSGQLATLLDWVTRLPEEAVARSAYLSVGCAWVYVLMRQAGEATRWLEAAEAALDAYEPLYLESSQRWVSAAEIRGDLATVRSYVAWLEEDWEGVRRHSEQALQHLPPEAHTIRSALTLNLGIRHQKLGDWKAAASAFLEAYEVAHRAGENAYVAVSALGLLGSGLLTRSRLSEAARHFRQAIESARASHLAGAPIHSVYLAHLGLATVHLERGELDAIAAHREAIEAIDKRSSLGPAMADVRMLDARVAHLLGDRARAHERLAAAQSLAGATPAIVALQAGLCLDAGDVPAAAALLATLDLDPAALPSGDGAEAPAGELAAYLVHARLLWAQQRAGAAQGSLRAVVTAARTARQIGVAAEALTRLALMVRSEGAAARGVEILAEALALAQPERFIAPFLRVGKGLLPLLQRLIAEQPGQSHALPVLQALEGMPVLLTGPETGEPVLVQPLTEREAQVLRLLAAGLNSTEIAETLVLAVSTVRSYIKTLYRKLDVHNRDEAIERAKFL